MTILDNGGKTIDRYTAILPRAMYMGTVYYPCITFSENPTDPQGFYQHQELPHPVPILEGEVVIEFNSLPKVCQDLLKQELE